MPDEGFPSPHEVAQRLLADAPDAAWIRALVDDLDRQLHAAPLERLISLWGLSASEAARMFDVSRQALSKWRQFGPPADRGPSIAAMDSATDLLDRYIKRERIPAVIRRPAANLGGKSLYEVACEGRHDQVRDTLSETFDLRRVQP